MLELLRKLFGMSEKPIGKASLSPDHGGLVSGMFSGTWAGDPTTKQCDVTPVKTFVIDKISVQLDTDPPFERQLHDHAMHADYSAPQLPDTPPIDQIIEGYVGIQDLYKGE